MSEIIVPFRLSQGKNKYIIFGGQDPQNMVLATVIDVADLEKILAELITQLDPTLHFSIKPADMKQATIKFVLERK